jgi:hypothetical protein
MPMTTGKFPLTVLLIVVIASASSFIPVQVVNAAPGIIYGDLSDGRVSGTGGINTVSSLRVGDDIGPPSESGRHTLVKFSLSGVSGQVASARLYLYLYNSNVDGSWDSISPLTNPGLGDSSVRHIDDFGTVDASDYNAPSIGNDPGILISGTSTPNIGYLSIDVTAAMQDDINKGRAFSAFLIRSSIESDGDDRADFWSFRSSDWDGTSEDPYIEYAFGPIGGILMSVNKLEILAPYLALVGLVGAVTAVFMIKKRRKD